MTSPDLIILGRDPEDSSRWLLECPECGLVRSVTCATMRRNKYRGSSRCQVCAVIRTGHANLKAIQGIPGQLIIIEQIHSYDAAGRALSLVECPGCGEQRLQYRDNTRRYQSTFCTPCSRTGERSPMFRPIEDIPGQVVVVEQIAGYNDLGHPFALVECPICGRQRLMKRSHIRGQQSTCCIYCSSLRGKDHPQWKGGYSHEPYPHNWREIAAYIRERDLHACQYPGCSKTEGLHGRQPDVHHIRPLSESDDNSEYNLITLCPEHHGWADAHLNKSIPILELVIDVIYDW